MVDDSIDICTDALIGLVVLVKIWPLVIVGVPYANGDDDNEDDAIDHHASLIMGSVNQALTQSTSEKWCPSFPC